MAVGGAAAAAAFAGIVGTGIAIAAAKNCRDDDSYDYYGGGPTYYGGGPAYYGGGPAYYGGGDPYYGGYGYGVGRAPLPRSSARRLVTPRPKESFRRRDALAGGIFLSFRRRTGR